GLRGGGGNFGIVTEFEFRLHEVPNAALLSTLSFPIEAAGSVLRTWRDLAAEAPRQATFTASLPGDQNVVTVGFVWVGHPATRRRMAVRSRTCPIRTPRLPSAVPPSSTSPRAGGPTRPKTIDAWRSRGGRPRLSTRSPEASTSIHSATKAPRASVACIHRTSSRG